jgi:hypothetical protein
MRLRRHGGRSAAAWFRHSHGWRGGACHSAPCACATAMLCCGVPRGRRVRCTVCWHAAGALVAAAAATCPPRQDTLTLFLPRAQVEQRVVDGLLGLIAAERGGETVDRGLLSNLLRCFTSLGMYATAFQARAARRAAPPGNPGGSSVAAPRPAGARLPRRRLRAGVVLMRSAPKHAQRPAGLLAASRCAFWQ